MKYTVYLNDGNIVIEEDLNFNFQSKEVAMKYFENKYPNQKVFNIVKDYNEFPFGTKLEYLSLVEIHLIGYLLQQYKDFYKQDEIKNSKVTDFKTIFIDEKLNLDYFSDLNKYISYSLFIEYEKYKKFIAEIIFYFLLWKVNF